MDHRGWIRWLDPAGAPPWDEREDASSCAVGITVARPRMRQNGAELRNRQVAQSTRAGRATRLCERSPHPSEDLELPSAPSNILLNSRRRLLAERAARMGHMEADAEVASREGSDRIEVEGLRL